MEILFTAQPGFALNKVQAPCIDFDSSLSKALAMNSDAIIGKWTEFLLKTFIVFIKVLRSFSGPFCHLAGLNACQIILRGTGVYPEI